MKIGVLVSGQGTNLQAILEAIRAGTVTAELVVVISNRPEAKALQRAQRFNVPAVVVDHTTFESREAFEEVLGAELVKAKVDLVCLAGFMRILTPTLIGRYRRRMLNIHPSLLPAFPGAHAIRDALAAGVTETGCTVHLVTEAVDGGPIILQAKVPVRPGDTEPILASRIREQEHRIYPRAIQLLVEGRVRFEGDRVTIQGGSR